MEEASDILSDIGSYVYQHLPSASSIGGMFFYSFVTYLFLLCLRILRNEALYPQIEKNISEAVRKKREENRAERSRQAQEMANKLE